MELEETKTDPEVKETNSNPEAEDSIDEGSGISMAAQLLLIALMLASIVYSISSRTFDDFKKYVSYIIIALSVISAVVLLVYILRNKLDKLFFRILLLGMILVPIAFFVAGITYYSAFVSLKDLFFWILSPSFTKGVSMTLTALLTLAVSLVLFYFRLKARSIYGLTEAAVGLVVEANRATTQTDEITSSGFYLAILTASVYLVVRGFDNIHHGLTKDPIDPYGTKIYAFLKKRV